MTEPSTRSEPSGPLLEPGAHVDQFRIMRLLGRGGMGEVYLARDTQLGRKVALKIVSPQVDRHNLVSRFRKEAELTARFNHPHIVTLYAVGETAGRPYVALEYLEGQTLRQRLDEDRPGFGEALRIALDIADALREAHRNQVLHLDLKPENVILPRDGRLRVVDFGLARVVADEAAGAASPLEDTQLVIPEEGEAAGFVVGTPPYLAPEQWLGEPTSPATDLWAFGVLLFELVTGRRPFEGASKGGLFNRVTSDQPAPALSTYQEVPTELNELVARCLEKPPGRRATADQAVQELERLLRQERRRVTAEENPYRGLLPFAERHSPLFFGRSSEVAAFVERLRIDPVLPLVGPSGCGKTSFLRAGIVPRLRDQGVWRVLLLRPGRNPFLALATRLLVEKSRGSGGSSPVAHTVPVRRATASLGNLTPVHAARRAFTLSDEDLAKRLRDRPRLLNLMLRDLAEQEHCRVLLVADQLEELFTLGEDDEARTQFLQAICTAADDAQEPVRVVFALRDSYLVRFAEVAETREVLSHVTVLHSPEPEALRETLVAPLELVGYRFEDEALVETMVEALRDEPASLPLLQFTCHALWERRDRKLKQLLRSAYRALGGVGGALVRHADAVLAGLSPTQLTLVRRMLLRLVHPDGTRRSRSASQLLSELGPEAEPLLERLTDARLLTVRQGGEVSAEHRSLELVHDSLVSAWQRLRRWLEESRDDVAFLAEVEAAAELWEQRGQRPEEVWRGAALRDAQRRRERYAGPLPRRVEAFLAEGARRERLAAWRVRGLLTAVFVVLAGFAGVMFTQKRDSDRQRDQARAARRQAEVRRHQADTARRRAHLGWAHAQREAAQSAFLRGRILEARSRLRGAMEVTDSPSGRALWQRLRSEPLQWSREVGAVVHAVDWSRDGHTIAVGCQDRVLYLFDSRLATPRLLRGHKDQILAVAVSPDGRRVATGTWSGAVALWDVRTGQPTYLVGHRKAVRSLAFRPDGRRLASAGVDGLIHLWDPATGALQSTLRGHTNTIFRVEYSPDGKRLASASMDRTARIWQDGRTVLTVKGHSSAVYTAAFSPDGKQLATGSADRTIRLWDARTGAPIRTLRGHEANVVSLLYRPGGDTLVSGSWDRTVRIWNPRSGALLQTLRGHQGGIYGAALSPDGRQLVTGAWDRTVRVWDLDIHRPSQAVLGHAEATYGVALYDGGRRAASASLDRTVRLWDVPSGRPISVLKGHVNSVEGLAVSPTGHLLATASSDGTARLWTLPGGQLKQVLVGHGHQVTDVAFSADGKRVVTGSADRSVRVWDVATGRRIRTFTGHTAEVWGVAFHPDGRRVLSCSNDKTVRIWDLATGTGRPLSPGPAHTDSVTGVAVSRDGRLVASGSDDKTIRLWDLNARTSRILARLPARVYWLAFDPSGTRVGAPLSDGTARIIDIRSGESVTLRGHRGEVNYLRFSKDGARVVTGSDDGTVRVWNARSGRPFWRTVAVLRKPPRLLTHRGWESLVGKVAPPPKARWARAFDERTVQASDNTDGSLMCLQRDDGTFEIYDLKADRRLVRRRLPGLRRLYPLADGCLVHAGDRALRVSRTGAEQRLGRGVEHLAVYPGGFLVATRDRVTDYDATGHKRSAQPLPSGVSALTRVAGRIVLGFRDGSLEWLRAAARTPTRVFAETPSSPVVSLAAGPLHTVIAGYANGELGLWSAPPGVRLDHWRLHGPIRHLLLGAGRLFAASDLGDYRVVDLRSFRAPYCELLREIWRQVPTRWDRDTPQLHPPPKSHRCTARGRDQGPP